MQVTIKFHFTLDLTNPYQYEENCAYTLYGDYSEAKKKRMLLKHPITENIPQTGGVYFLMQEGAVFYIGRSNNLQTRILSHLANDNFVEKLDEIALQFESDIPKQYVIEAVAIAEFLPSENKLGKTV